MGSLGEQSADILRCSGTLYRTASNPIRATCHVWYQHIHRGPGEILPYQPEHNPSMGQDDEMRQVRCPAVTKVVLCGESKYLRGSSQQCET